MSPIELPDDPALWRMLSVRQPWADLLVADAARIEFLRPAIGDGVAALLPKHIENRTQMHSWRGWTLIHASAWPRYDGVAMQLLNLRPNLFTYGVILGAARMCGSTRDTADQAGRLLKACGYCGTATRDCLPDKAIHGGCCDLCNDVATHLPAHPRGMWARWGAVHWEFADPIRLAEPVQGVKGALGLIRPLPEVLYTVLSRLRCQLEGGTR